MPLAWKEGTGIFLHKLERKARMITLTSFQLKWLEKLVLYHINEDNNVQAKLSASQYGFRAELLRKLLCMNLCAVWSIALFEKSHLWVFSWILSAPSTMSPSEALLQLCEGWACLRFSPHG